MYSNFPSSQYCNAPKLSYYCKITLCSSLFGSVNSLRTLVTNCEISRLFLFVTKFMLWCSHMFLINVHKVNSNQMTLIGFLFRQESHRCCKVCALTIKLYLLSWSERWMTIFGSSGEFQEAFFYHIASWKVDVCVIAFLNTVDSCSRLYPPTRLMLAFLPPLLNWSNSKGGPTRK